MNFGINTFLFTSPFTNESISLFPQFKKWGFDSVEIAIEDTSHIDVSLIKKALDENELKCNSICAAMGPGRDLRGTIAEQHQAINYIKSVLDIMPELGCPVLAGPLYSTVGRAEATERAVYNMQWETVARHLKMLSGYAEISGLKLAIEPLNRYETDFINTCDQALNMINDVGSDALFIHLDTYHMNIEEKDPAKAILKAGKKLGHIHACGSDRGMPGSDQINWASIRLALEEIGYNQSVVIESFTPDVKVIARAASVWREFEKSPEDIAGKGLQFLRSLLLENNS
jgi:D-psicose/D-tagatose/L-ribulose 3-epimerase